MPIKVPGHLPAVETLTREGVELITEERAARQDIRPLEIAILNLMPLKEVTETQLARMLGLSPLQVNLTLLTTGSHESRNTSKSHLQQFYLTPADVADRKFDGLIVTGAPIETLPFEAVDYWPELAGFFDWSRGNVHSLFSVCWGAQAALKHFHGVEKHLLPQKKFGIYRHQNLAPASALMRGINDTFPIPVSRHTEVLTAEIPADRGLNVLAESPEAGLCLLEEPAARRFYMFNHLEYDADTLQREYERDVATGAEIQLPANYFPDDDPARAPVNQWRSHAHMLFNNWLYLVYQSTPYDLADIGRD